MALAKVRFSVIATFSDEATARAASEALSGTGVTDAAASIMAVDRAGAGDRRSVAAREGRFLWRFVVIVALWSIVGVGVGAAMALLFVWTGGGPGGKQGIVLQVVSWTIFWHLILGLWAGYFLLADRSQPEMAPDRAGSALLSVRCRGGEIGHVRGVLSDCGALGIRVIAVQDEQ